jgi:hypothetical protein
MSDNIPTDSDNTQNNNTNPPVINSDTTNQSNVNDTAKKSNANTKNKKKPIKKSENSSQKSKGGDPANILGQNNKWMDFLDHLEKKYQPINPNNFKNDTQQNNTSLVISEDPTQIQNVLESGLTTPSEVDPDYIPNESSSSPSSSSISSSSSDEDSGEDSDEDGEENESDDQPTGEDSNLMNLETDMNKLLDKLLGKYNLSKNPYSSTSISQNQSLLPGFGKPLIWLFPIDGDNHNQHEGCCDNDNNDNKENKDNNESANTNDKKDRKRANPNTPSLTNDFKRQKMNALDREYKSFLMTKEKDVYEHFCGLDLETKNKIIKEEKLVKDLSCDKEPMRIKVINSTLPPLIKGEIIRKIGASKSLFGKDNKMLDWVDHIMRVPWSTYYPMPITINDTAHKIGEYMTSIYNRMDQAVYGHNETKCHIMQIIGKWITNPSAVGNCLALQGPMGIGKTTLVKEGLAPALGRPFNFISLGGATDASFLEGHSFTYEGSIPGQIVEVIQRSKCMNPIIYFDELDKISKSHRGEEIANLLIHITDTQQNDKFHDKYFGNIDIDLSKVFFVFSYNHDENVPPILKDRLQVVRIKGYNSHEKCKIVNEYMFPRFCKDMGFEKDQLIISDDVINYLINNFSEKEDGVRNLGRCIETIVSRLNMIRLIQGSLEMPDTNKFIEKLPFKATKIPIIKQSEKFEITRDIVDNILDKIKVNESFHHMYL